MRKSGLKLLRVAAGISQKQLAEKIGVTQAAISHIEKGLRKPNPKRWKQMADVLGISVAVLEKDLNYRDDRLIASWRRLSGKKKDMVLAFCIFMETRKETRLEIHPVP